MSNCCSGWWGHTPDCPTRQPAGSGCSCGGPWFGRHAAGCEAGDPSAPSSNDGWGGLFSMPAPARTRRDERARRDAAPLGGFFETAAGSAWNGLLGAEDELAKRADKERAAAERADRSKEGLEGMARNGGRYRPPQRDHYRTRSEIAEDNIGGFLSILNRVDRAVDFVDRLVSRDRGGRGRGR